MLSRKVLSLTKPKGRNRNPSAIILHLLWNASNLIFHTVFFFFFFSSRPLLLKFLKFIQLNRYSPLSHLNGSCLLFKFHEIFCKSLSLSLYLSHTHIYIVWFWVEWILVLTTWKFFFVYLSTKTHCHYFWSVRNALQTFVANAINVLWFPISYLTLEP